MMLWSSLRHGEHWSGNAFTCSSSKSFSQGGIDDGDFVHHSQELIGTPVVEGMSHSQLCQHAPRKLLYA